MDYTVSVLACNNYDLDELIEKIEKSILLIGGLKNFIKSGDKVLIKPNLLSAKSPDKACTTHPLFLKALITILKKSGAKLFLGDSPAIMPLTNVAMVSGIKKICEEENVPLINLKTPVEVKNPQGRIVKSFVLAKEVFEFDKIINVPKLKNHSLTVITVAVKNLFGTIPGPRKGQYHLRFQDSYNFSQMLIDLNMIVKPAFSIVDGIVGMEGEGPADGEPKKCGVIIAGDNTVAVDYVSSIIMGYNPDNIPIIKAAKDAKFGGYSSNLIDLKGDDIDSLIVKDFKRLKGTLPDNIFIKIGKSIARNFIIKKPFILKEKCVGCGDCKNICPPKTIEIIDKKARINYKNCIRCYCCFEVCRYSAIKLKYF